MDKGIITICVHLFILGITIHSGDAIKCYSCSSLTEPKCADPISSEMQSIDCAMDLVHETMALVRKSVSVPSSLSTGQDAPFTCFKMDTHAKTTTMNKTTLRGCQTSNPCGDLKQRIVDGSVLMFCDVCTTDYCNGGHATTFSVVTVLLSSIMALLVLKN